VQSRGIIHGVVFPVWLGRCRLEVKRGGGSAISIVGWNVLVWDRGGNNVEHGYNNRYLLKLIIIRIILGSNPCKSNK